MVIYATSELKNPLISLFSIESIINIPPKLLTKITLNKKPAWLNVLKGL